MQISIKHKNDVDFNRKRVHFNKKKNVDFNLKKGQISILKSMQI